MGKNKKSSVKNEKKRINFYLLPILIILSILPLATRLYVIDLEPNQFLFWTGEDITYDFFGWVKRQILLFSTILSVILFIYGFFKKEVDFKNINKKLWIIVGCYAFFIIISSIFSEFNDLTIYGFPGKWEGIFVQLSYLFLFIYSALFIKKDDINILLVFFFSSAIVMAMISATQFINRDIFETSFMKSIIIPDKYAEIREFLHISIGDNQAYGTLANPNHIGTYVSLLIPIAVFTAFSAENKKLKYLSILATISGVFMSMTSRSRAGYIGIFSSILLAMFIYRKKIIIEIKRFSKTQLIKISILFLTVFLSINIVSGGAITNQVSRLSGDIVKLVLPVESIDYKEYTHLQDLFFDESTFYMKTRNMDIKINYSRGKLSLHDKNNNLVEYRKIDDEIKITTSGYESVTMYNFTYNDKDLVVIIDEYESIETPEKPAKIGALTSWSKKIQGFIFKEKEREEEKLNDIRFYISLDENKGIQLLENKMQPVTMSDLYEVDFIGFQGKERLGSGRGYIWSRSLPLLRNSVFTGYGPDSFPAIFPQYELFPKLYATYNNFYLMNDKPHNIFLDIALSYGVFALILFISLNFIIIRNSILDKNNYIKIGLSLSLVAFLLAGLFNDSMIQTTVIYYALLGILVNKNN